MEKIHCIHVWYFSVGRSEGGTGTLRSEGTNATALEDSLEEKKKGSERRGTETKARDGKNHHAGLTDTHSQTRNEKKKNERRQKCHVIVVCVLNSSSRSRRDGGEDSDSQSRHKHKKGPKNRKEKETNKTFSADQEKKLKR